LGVTAGHVLRGDPERSIRFHKAIAALLALDLVIRVIPVRASIAFGIPAAVCGFAVRAVCLYLVIKDLRTETQR